MIRASIALCIALAVLVRVSASDEWPQFRGRAAGVADDNPSLPDTWSQTDHVVWSAVVPGVGWSSPIVSGDLIFVTSVIPSRPVALPERGFYATNSRGAVEPGEHRWMLYAIDVRTGRVRWEHEVRRATPGASTHPKNSYASETPVTDGERVYVYFGGIGLFAFGMDGKPLWSQSMDPKQMRGWGTAASPVLFRGRVYVVDDNDDQSSMTAYDARTGNVAWRVPRDEGSNWSTPFVWEHAPDAEIVTTGSRKVRAYDLTGKLKWELSGMTTLHIPTPFAKLGLLFVSSGYLADPVRPVYAIRPGGSGDLSLKDGERSNQFVAWSQPRLGTYGTSPLVYGDYYYALMDRGFLQCNDARTGEEIYARQRVTAEASGFTASPWAYNGKVFALSEDGDTFVMQAGSSFKVLGKNSLGEMALATPAIANGSLFVRTATRLYRISNRVTP